MWPDYTEMTEQTVTAENVVEDLYSEALHAWMPALQVAVLPTLPGGGDLFPDLDAVMSAQSRWDELVDTVVLPGVTALWERTARAAASADALTAASPRAIIKGLRNALDDFLLDFAGAARQVPEIARDALLAVTRGVDLSLAESRALVRSSVMPGSQMLRKLSRRLGYQASSILNHAVMSVARHLGHAEHKMWVAILDERTRDTHWIADGQTVELAGEFMVGGVTMAFPGDPRAPARETANCRCRLAVLAVSESPKPRHGPPDEEAKRIAHGVVHEPMAASVATSEQENDMSAETFRTFTDAVIALIGTRTSDNRMLSSGIELSFRDMPLPLMWTRQSTENHLDAFTVGVIEAASVADGKVLASGYLLNTAEADEAAMQIKHGVTGPSVDLAAAEWKLIDDSGTELTAEDLWDLSMDAKVIMNVVKAELIGTTLVSKPAFGATVLSLNEEREPRDSALVAGTAEQLQLRVKTYDPKLFDDPKLTRPTAPTMDNETGRIYGHMAEWGHAIRGGNGELIPRNYNGYANFHTSQVQLDNGKQLSVGRLTVQGGHADTRPGVTIATARAHYDNVCTAFGLVRVGEDKFGIWFSGVPAPGVDPEVFQAGMTAPLSGDWRHCESGLDMIAAHAVNNPGFPIYSALTGPDGQDVVLVASLGPSRKTVGGGFTLDRDSLKMLLTEVVETVDTRRAERQRETMLAVERDEALARAMVVAGAPPTPNEQATALLAEAGL